MTNSQLVEHTYKKHNVWLTQCAYNLTGNKLEAEELVQNLYLKLMEMTNIQKIMYKQDINLFYLYKMLRSAHLNGIKKQTNHLPIDDDLLNKPAEEYSYSADNEFEERLRLTNEALEQEYWFGAQLLKVYVDEDHSIQSLHNVTGISNSTIWTQLRKTKTAVRNYVKKNMQ
jgi:DNA-directed RNA polymerase specialized sigma24 family protein